MVVQRTMHARVVKTVGDERVAVATALFRHQGRQLVTLIGKITAKIVENDIAVLRDPEPVAALPVYNDPAARTAPPSQRDPRWTPSLRTPSEIVPRLFATDVIVHAAAYQQGGREAPSRAVGFGMYRQDRPILHKRLYVYGDYTSNGCVPFRRMPIEWERAFGGPENELNPVGRGMDGRLPSPNVIDPRNARYPAGFAPLSSQWPVRTKLLSGRSAIALEGMDIAMPDDVSFAFFQSAPHDQRVRYLQGDEWLVFEGLHPHLEQYQARLPKLRIAAQLARDDGKCEDVPMVLDMLTVDAEARSLSCVFRGSAPLDGDPHRYVAGFGLELPNGMVAWPDKFTRTTRAVALAAAMVPASGQNPLAKDVPDAAFETFRLDPQAHMRAALAPATPWVADGVDAEPTTTDDEEVPFSNQTVIGAMNIDPNLPAFLGLKPRARSVTAPVVPVTAPPASAPIAPPPAAPVAVAPASSAAAAAAEPAASAMSIGPSALLGMRGLAELSLGGPATFDINALPTTTLAPTSREETGVRKDVLDRVKAKQRIDLDLTGADLSGLDLSGAWLSEGKLDRAMLSGTKLDGANLRGARLSSSDLRGASLQNADLSEAKLSRATLDGTDLRNAKLMGADLEFVRASGATMTGVQAERIVLSHSHWAQSSFDGANLRDARLEGASFEGSTLLGVDLEGAQLGNLRAEGVDFRDAKLDRTTSDSAVFRGCDLRGVVARRAAWDTPDLEGAVLANACFEGATSSRAKLDGADLSSSIFREASLLGASFVGSRLEGANFEGADLRQARMTNARASDARFCKANGQKLVASNASLRGADFTGANLRFARLDRVDLTNGRLTDCDLRDANLQGSTLSGADREGAKLGGANLRDVIDEPTVDDNSTS